MIGQDALSRINHPDLFKPQRKERAAVMWMTTEMFRNGEWDKHPYTSTMPFYAPNLTDLGRHFTQHGKVGDVLETVDNCNRRVRYTLIAKPVKRKFVRFTSPRNGGESCDYPFPMTTHIEDATVDINQFFSPSCSSVGDAITIECHGVTTRYELIEREVNE